MNDLTVCIPIGPGHAEIAARARESVKAQTIPVVGIAFVDEEGRGAGWARNQLLAQVQTPYVAFLDADDWLVPEFADHMLQQVKMVESQGKYVYSGWFLHGHPDGDQIVEHPPKECYCWKQGEFHIITAVVRTEWALAIGGFDERLPGAEDTEFWYKMRAAGHCGILLDEPLVHWDASKSERSVAFHKHPQRDQFMREMAMKYRRDVMPCCQGQGVTNQGPFGERQPGDILARAMGAAFQIYVGRQSDRIYANVGHGQLVWADPRDVESDPNRFQRADQDTEARLTQVSQIGAYLQQNVNPPLATEPTRPPVSGRKSVADLKKMAGLE